MKKIGRFLFCLGMLLIGLPGRAQTLPLAPVLESKSSLTKFDLDFQGGTAAELVAAIQKASGKPLNAIIPDYYSKHQLPALKMRGVDVGQLFSALSESTRRVDQAIPGMFRESQMGFRTGGQPTDASIWYFYVEEHPLPPKSSRFYVLTPYLEQGFTVDDITTAVQTAWKLRGDSPIPVMNFHRETKLLIAVGYDWQLGVINEVLEALGQRKMAGKNETAAAETKPAS